MLFGFGIIAAKENVRYPKSGTHVWDSSIITVGYHLSVWSIDQVFVLKMRMIFVISEKF